MKEKHIITIEQLKGIGRPIGKMVSEDKLNAFITEAEQLHIKPILGDKLFIQVLEESNKDSISDERISLLLDGGVYNGKEYGKKDIDQCSFMGLRTALSYFVYAQNLMSGDVESTRYGFNVKEGDYSSHVSSKTRSDIYNNAIEIGKAYLKECVEFCKVSGLIHTEGQSKINIGGLTIRKIG